MRNQINLHQKLTEILFENGCTVNKIAIDHLTEFVTTQQKNIVEQFLLDAKANGEYIDRQVFEPSNIKDKDEN